MQRLVTVLTATLALGLAAETAQAEEQSRGALEYQNSCRVCHGTTAKGDGPFAEVMKIPVPDLTIIAQNNEGRFPVEEIVKIIDGRTRLRGHGSLMPVWGARYKAEEEEKWGPPWGMGAEFFARSRILELTFYLQSIQE